MRNIVSEDIGGNPNVCVVGGLDHFVLWRIGIGLQLDQRSLHAQSSLTHCIRLRSLIRRSWDLEYVSFLP